MLFLGGVLAPLQMGAQSGLELRSGSKLDSPVFQPWRQRHPQRHERRWKTSDSRGDRPREQSLSPCSWPPEQGQIRISGHAARKVQFSRTEHIRPDGTHVVRGRDWEDAIRSAAIQSITPVPSDTTSGQKPNQRRKRSSVDATSWQLTDSAKLRGRGSDPSRDSGLSNLGLRRDRGTGPIACRESNDTNNASDTTRVQEGRAKS